MDGPRSGSAGAVVANGQGGWGHADGHTRLLGVDPPDWVAECRGEQGLGKDHSTNCRAVAPLRRHIDGGNYLFADGHVKWFSWQNMPNSKVEKRDGSGPQYYPN